MPKTIAPSSVPLTHEQSDAIAAAGKARGEVQLLARLRRLLSGTDGRSDLPGMAELETCDRQQILDLLFSSYEQAAALTAQLEARQWELARSNETLNSLFDLAGGLNHCHSEAEVTSFAVEGALKIPGVRAAWIFLRENKTYWLAAQAGAIDIDHGDESAGEPQQLCACQQRLEANFTDAVNVCQCCYLNPDMMDGNYGHVSIPLIIAGAGAGLLNIVSDLPGGTFSADQIPMLASVGSQISDAVQRARLQEALERRVEERTRHLEAEIVQRRWAERDVRAANERLLDAIDSINDGFALYDANDRLFVHNRRYLDMHAAIRHLMVPGVKFEALTRACLDFGEGRINGSTKSHAQARLQTHHTADGKPVVLRRGDSWLMVTERRTREGGIVVVETDITELKKADIAKDEFLAKISHELRTPLTPINGALSIIGSGKLGELPKGVTDLNDAARRNCARLIAIVDNLLDFTQITSGRFDLNCTLIDLRPFVEQVIASKRIGPCPPMIELDVRARTDTLTIEADASRIQQVLDSLLSNAIKFCEPSDPIAVALDHRNGWICVSVTDKGPGIPEHFQSRIFEAFSQEDCSSTRRIGGVGLGLSIAKSIIEAHGGQIGFTTEEGRGTTFFFELPPAQNVLLTS